MHLQKVEPKGLHICEKCGNVMVTRVIRRNHSFDPTKLDKILQCVICKFWKEA